MRGVSGDGADRLGNDDRGAERRHRAGHVDDRPQAQPFADRGVGAGVRIGFHVQQSLDCQAAISTTASISTVMFPGSEPTPIAERAWPRILSKTSANRSEQPLTTFGWSLKVGVALTKPSSLTTRTMRPRSPAAACMAASNMRAATR